MRKLIWAGLLPVVLFACHREDSELTQSSPSAWSSTASQSATIKQLYADIALKPEVITGTITDTTVIGGLFSGGLTIGAYLAFDSASGGWLHSGTYKLEALFLKSPGAMISMNRPTETENGLLISRGSLYYRLTVDGRPALLRGAWGSLPVTSRSARNGLPILFSGGSMSGRNVWSRMFYADSAVLFSNGGSGPVTIPPGQGLLGNERLSFAADFQNFRWINCDYFFRTPEPKVILAAHLPATFNPVNTVAYFAMTDSLLVTGLVPDSASQSFRSPYYLPVGIRGDVVTISRIDTAYYLGHETLNLPSTGDVVLIPQHVGKSEVIRYLQNL